MALAIVKAEDVRADEPRIWCLDHGTAYATLENWRADDVKEALHLRPDTAPLGRAAIVDRAVPVGIESPAAMMEHGAPRTRAGDMFALAEMLTNEHTPEATRGEVAWQEMVWRQAFNAFLSAVPEDTWTETLDQTIAASCAHMADAALVEWKKRWQR